MTCRKSLRVIGLTGGVATGKSTVARFFQEHGSVVIDADEISREAVIPGSRALESIAVEFGTEMLLPDGSLNRKRLGTVIFADADKRRQLEHIIHPEIRRLSEELIDRAREAGQKLVFYMAPLLIEAGATDRVNEIWVVTTSPEIQLERLMARDGISRAEAQCIIASQMPLAEKERFGRIIIDNSGTLEQTLSLLSAIWEKEIGSFYE